VVGVTVKHKSKGKMNQKCFQHAANGTTITAGRGTAVFTAS